MEQLLQANRYPVFDYKDIIFGKHIGSGYSGDVYKGTHQKIKIIAKGFYASNYEDI